MGGYRNFNPGFRTERYSFGSSVGGEVSRAAIWVVVKIMGPFWISFIIRHLIFRVPKKGP